MDKWKELVKAAFEEAAPAGFVFIDCDLWNKKLRLEIGFMDANKKRRYIAAREIECIEPSDEAKLKIIAKTLGERCG